MLKCFKFSCVFLLFTNTVFASELRVASDIWCPYICDTAHDKGVLIDVLRTIAKEQNVPFSFHKMPLSRAVQKAQNQQIDIVLALTQAHIDEYGLKRSRIAFGAWSNDFYVKRTSAWRFHSVDTLSQELGQSSLAAIKGYQYGKKLDNVLQQSTNNVHFASGVKPLEQNLRLLEFGRIDILLDSRYNVDYSLKQLGYKDIVYAGTEGKKIPLYIGYSKHVPDNIIKLFDDGLESLRQSQRLSMILKHYHISDWQ